MYAQSRKGRRRPVDLIDVAAPSELQQNDACEYAEQATGIRNGNRIRDP